VETVHAKDGAEKYRPVQATVPKQCTNKGGAIIAHHAVIAEQYFISVSVMSWT
jgi:hypothetical protein